MVTQESRTRDDGKRGSGPLSWTFTFDDIAEAVGMSGVAVRKHYDRDAYDPHDLASLAIWIARHAPVDLKQKINLALLNAGDAGVGRRTEPKKKRAKD